MITIFSEIGKINAHVIENMEKYGNQEKYQRNKIY